LSDLPPATTSFVTVIGPSIVAAPPADPAPWLSGPFKMVAPLTVNVGVVTVAELVAEISTVAALICTSGASRITATGE
jgi:hypothetical protein